MAWLLGADRELDSSITIKRIVSHLFQFNLSHSNEMFQDPNCPNQRDEDITRDTRETRDTRGTPSKQASNEQQEATEKHLPIESGHIMVQLLLLWGD